MAGNLPALDSRLGMQLQHRHKDIWDAISSGTMGTSGTSGTMGTSGTSGAAGTSGTAGTSGISEIVGWTEITGDTDAAAYSGYFINAANNPVTLTLPAPGPSIRVAVRVIGSGFAIVIKRNGSEKIEGAAEDISPVDITNAGFILIWSGNVDKGWVIEENMGWGSGTSGTNGSSGTSGAGLSGTWGTITGTSNTAVSPNGYFMDAAGGACTLTLPVPAQSAEVYFITKSVANTTTIARNAGEKIEGNAGNLILNVPTANALVSDGTDWYLKNK